MTQVVKRKVGMIVTYITHAAIAAKNATSTILIVDVVMGDPDANSRRVFVAGDPVGTPGSRRASHGQEGGGAPQYRDADADYAATAVFDHADSELNVNRRMFRQVPVVTVSWCQFW